MTFGIPAQVYLEPIYQNRNTRPSSQGCLGAPFPSAYFASRFSNSYDINPIPYPDFVHWILCANFPLKLDEVIPRYASRSGMGMAVSNTSVSLRCRAKMAWRLFLIPISSGTYWMTTPRNRSTSSREGCGCFLSSFTTLPSTVAFGNIADAQESLEDIKIAERVPWVCIRTRGAARSQCARTSSQGTRIVTTVVSADTFSNSASVPLTSATTPGRSAFCGAACMLTISLVLNARSPRG